MDYSRRALLRVSALGAAAVWVSPLTGCATGIAVAEGGPAGATALAEFAQAVGASAVGGLALDELKAHVARPILNRVFDAQKTMARVFPVVRTPLQRTNGVSSHFFLASDAEQKEGCCAFVVQSAGRIRVVYVEAPALAGINQFVRDSSFAASGDEAKFAEIQRVLLPTGESSINNPMLFGGQTPASLQYQTVRGSVAAQYDPRSQMIAIRVQGMDAADRSRSTEKKYKVKR